MDRVILVADAESVPRGGQRRECHGRAAQHGRQPVNCPGLAARDSHHFEYPARGARRPHKASGIGDAMKLNFWQWLGVILLVVGVAVWIYERTRPAATPAPSTQSP